MSQYSIQQKFANPHDEIHKLQRDLITNFGEPLAGAVNHLALEYTEETHNFICNIVLTPFVEINRLAEALPKNPSKEQYHQFLEEIFKRANPADTIDNINTMLKTGTINLNYKKAIQKFEESSVVKGLFEKAKFDTNVIQTIQQSAMANIEHTLKALREYIKGLQNHQQIVRDVAKSQSSKTALKTGASILGLGLGVPFLGMGLGALMKSGDKTKINESINQLLTRLDHLSEKLSETIINMNHSIHLMYLTLIGGTVVTVNEMLKRKHCYISHINELNVIHYEIVDEEKAHFTKWIETTTAALNTLMEQKRYAEAIVLAKKFYEEVVQNPIHARVVLLNKRTALHIAHTYYFAIYQETLLAEYRSGHVESFVRRGNELVRHLIMEIYDDKLPPFATDPSYFFVLLIKETLKQDGEEAVDKMAKSYVGHMIQRAVVQDVLHEQLVDSPISMNAGMLALLYFYLEGNVEKLTDAEKQVIGDIANALSPKRIKQLIKLDQTFNTNDAFTFFLKDRYNYEVAYRVGMRTRGVLRLVLIAAIIVGIVFGIYKFADPAREKVSELWDKGIAVISDDDDSEKALFVEEQVGQEIAVDETATGIEIEASGESETGFFASLKEKVTSLWSKVTGLFSKDEEQEDQTYYTMTINVESASIRNVPNYNASEIIGYAVMGQQFIFENVQVQDEGGTDITWLEVALPDGTTGYISSKIVTITEYTKEPIE